MSKNSLDHLESNLKSLDKDNNFYVATALKKLAKAKSHEIHHICKLLGFDGHDINKVQLAYIQQLATIKFMPGYVKREIKSVSHHDFTVDHASLMKYIDKHNPLLRDAELFVFSMVDRLSTDKERLLDTINSIRNEINNYSNDNKKLFVQEFNHNIDHLRTKLHKEPYLRVATQIKSDLRELLTTLQTKEHNYYHGIRFFSGYRKANSSLQPKITSALALLDKLVGEQAEHHRIHLRS